MPHARYRHRPRRRSLPRRPRDQYALPLRTINVFLLLAGLAYYFLRTFVD